MDAPQTFDVDSPVSPEALGFDSAIIQACPACGVDIDISEHEPLSTILCPSCAAPFVVGAFVDHYQLLSVAGRGGMGVVYKALDTSLNREVALKLLRRDRLTAKSLAELDTEAAITASINHPHVVRVFTTGSAQGRFYIAMELVEKGTLDDLIHLQGRVAETQALDVAIQVAQGLQAAHSHGLIHRDVKPGNILFADSHTAKIVDFGLAMLEDAAAKAEGNEIWGTPYYVAPEKLDQQPEDLRSDMYSLGASLFHALAGRPPFEAEDASMVALKHLKSQAVSLQAFAPWVSGSTAYVINRTLLKDPAARYQTYDELIEHLEYARSELLARGTQPVEKKRVVLETEQDQKLWSYLAVGMVGLCAVLAACFFLFIHKPSSTPQRKSPAALSSVGGSTQQAAAYEGARQQLLSGKIATAASAFHALTEDKSTPPPLFQWAALHEGLAALLSGNRAAAASAFSSLREHPHSATDGTGQKLGEFFTRIATLVEGESVVPATAMSQFSRDDYAALGMLVIALHNWNLGRYDEAGGFLRSYDSATPKGEFSWAGDYKKLVRDYLSDFTDYRGAVALAKAARNPADRDHAKHEIEAIKSGLKRKEMASGFEPLLAQIADDTHDDSKVFDAARLQSVELSRNWNFRQASDSLQATPVSSSTDALTKATLRLKLGWLGEFKQGLIDDASIEKIRTAVIKKADGSTVPRLKSLSDLGAVSQDGAVVPWKDLAPKSILDLAQSLAGTSSRKAWNAGIFALFVKDWSAAKTLLNLSLKAMPDYEDAADTLLSTTGVNLARTATATASAFNINGAETQSAEKAIDGSLASKWCSLSAAPQWLKLDLGSDSTIDRWVVKHAEAGGESADFNTVDFALEKSSDGLSWTAVDSVQGNIVAVTDRKVTPFTSRFVRLMVRKPTRTTDQGTRIDEFELYGKNAPLELLGSLQIPLLPKLAATNIGLPQDAQSGHSETDRGIGTLSIEAAGADFWLKADAGRFIGRPMRGDGNVVAFIESVDWDGWAKCGVMVRESLAPDARNVFAAVTGANGVTAQNRKDPAGDTFNAGDPGTTKPCWVKIERVGDTYSLYDSRDGSQWNRVGDPITLPMGPHPFVGLAACSHINGVQGSAKATGFWIND